MTDEASLFSPEQIDALRRQRQDLLDLIESSQDTIARCEDMLTRVDAVLERDDVNLSSYGQPEHQQETGSGLLARWFTRKAS